MKILITASVVAGIALGAVACSNTAPPQAQSTVSNEAVRHWADLTGLPVTRALQMELMNNPGMAIKDATLALGDSGASAPAQDVQDAYTAAVEDYLTLAYDKYNASYARIPMDKDTADKAYVTFLVSLSRYGIHLSG